jgi:hypothetical protein
MLAKAAHQLVIESSNIIHKVKSTIQQAHSNRLFTQLLKGDTINKIFEFIQKSASDGGLEPLIKKPSDLYQVKVSYFSNQLKT